MGSVPSSDDQMGSIPHKVDDKAAMQTHGQGQVAKVQSKWHGRTMQADGANIEGKY